MAMLKLREEAQEDFAAVEQLVTAAFDQPGEARLVAALRKANAATLSLVAEDHGEILGHVLYSPVTVDGLAVPVLGLAPISVLPARQRRGVGSLLMRESLARVRALGYRGVVLLGHPDYYPRFGFQPAHTFGLRCIYDAPPEAFMALALQPGGLDGIHGTVRYHPAFDTL